MPNGYMGRILWADLEKGKITEETLDEKLCRQYIGGYGLGARILFDRMKPGIDPLGPLNILGFMTGPLSGTPALGGSRYTVVGKSPVTGGWCDSNSGGNFGPQLKFSGYDGVFFTGKASGPVYLCINSGKAELRDAGYLWGKDSYETEEALKKELGNDVEVACIGPAGEKLSLMSAVVNNHGRTAARGGMGAVMGSKKLKAVAVKGKLSVPLADEKWINNLRKDTKLGGNAEEMNQYGTSHTLIPLVFLGDSPIKNWSGLPSANFPNPMPIGGDAVIARQKAGYGCYRCPLSCGGKMEGGTGEYEFAAGSHKPEYETLAMFGPNILNNNLESIIKINDLCNRYGLDTISAGGTIAMAIECYENGILTKEDTDGLELTWGNHRAIVALTEKIAKREGFGDILADGARPAAERIGKGAESYAMHIQGQEFAAHNPRFLFGLALVYKMDATPARHCQGAGPAIAGLPVPPINIRKQAGMQPAYKLGYNFMHVIQSLGLCIFVYWTMPDAEAQLDAIKAVTGWDVTFEELFLTGERIANIRHLFNLREGLNPLNFEYPGRIAGRPPMEAGPQKGVTIDEELIIGDYLKVMDWDPVTTKPGREKLRELDLEFAILSLNGYNL